MLLFLDYIIRAVVTAVIIISIYASSVTSIRVGPFQISNYSFDIKKLILNSDLMFHRYGPIKIKWNFRAFTIDFPDMEFLSIHYSKFRDILTLQNVNILYWANNIKCSIKSNGQNDGIIHIYSSDILEGLLELEYKIDGPNIVFTKNNKSKCKVILLDYFLDYNDKLIISHNLLQAKTNIITDKVNGYIEYMQANEEHIKYSGYFHFNLPRITGEIHTKISDELIEINSKLDSIEFIKLVAHLLKLFRLLNLNHVNTSFNKYQVRDVDIRIRCTHCKSNNNVLKNFILHCYLSDLNLKELYCFGQFNSHDSIKAISNNYSPIKIVSSNISEVFKLFLPISFINSGHIVCTLDWNNTNKSWSLKARDTCIPFLNTLNIKQIISPIRWIRMLIQNPNFIGSISGNGCIRDNRIYLSKVTGLNDYYKLNLNGYIDFYTNIIDITMLIGSSHLLNSIGEASSIDVLKDIIKVHINGALNKPQTNVTVQPCSIIATLLQPILI